MGGELAGWRTRHLATRLHVFETTTSTQDEARRLIETGQANGALVIAREQTAGRGRFGRVWHSPRGNLYLSLIMRPQRPLSDWPQVTPMVALALAEAIESVVASPVALKWPNDVLLAGRKVAGILAEAVGDYLILGVGVNVRSEPPAGLADATSLEQVSGYPIETTHLLQDLVERLDRYYDEWLQGGQFMQRWASRLQTIGESVRVRVGEQMIEGVAEGVDDTGALRVRHVDGRQTICRAGEVSLRA